MDESFPKDSEGSGKGKAKASNDEVPENSSSPPTDQPLSKRVMESAAGLLHDAVGSSGGHAPAILSSSSALGGKSQAGGASSGSSTWAQSKANTRPGKLLNDSGTGQQDSAVNGPFRTQQPQSSTTEDFDQFSSHPVGSTLGLESISEPAWSSVWTTEFTQPLNQAELESFSRSHATKDLRTLHFPKNPHVVYAPNNSTQFDDGAEVRNLLSNPTFEPFSEDLNAMSMDDTTANDLFPQNFSTLEQTAVNAIRSDLPPPPTHRNVPIDHPLNLRPRSDAEKELIQQEVRDYSELFELGSRSLTTIPSEAEKEHWLSEWDDVLNSYSDQVWGDMLPAVKEAKSQLEDVRSGAATLDSKTIARLRMILGHVHQHDGPPAPDLMFAKQPNNHLE